MPEFGFEGYLKSHPNATLEEYDAKRKAALEKHSAQDPRLNETYTGCIVANLDKDSIQEINQGFRPFTNH